MEFKAKWIKSGRNLGDICPVFRRKFTLNGEVLKARLIITALGVYEAIIGGERIGKYVLAPGWTSYQKRLQYQIYDITDLLKRENEICVTVGKGWYSSPMPSNENCEDRKRRVALNTGLFAEIHILYKDGSKAVILTDESWEYSESAVRFSEIYDGETYDAGFTPTLWEKVEIFTGPTEILIPQEGEIVKEQERFAAKSVFKTPAGDIVVDFGQEITGYTEFEIEAKAGERIQIQHAEVLDKEGNFYNENYRSAKAEINYICKGGKQRWHPKLTFFGFRYIRLIDFPLEAKPEQFTAIAVYSDIRQTGKINCSDKNLNRLFSNIFWGQRGNFLDIPTDCPQRDERFGWTGDAQVFIKAASYNFDTRRFFTKWLHDLSADQKENGLVPEVIPDYFKNNKTCAAWGDAAVICPWQIYLTYGDEKILYEQFDSMRKWIDYITMATKDRYLWTGGIHYGDWLALDAPAGSYKGSSREDFIASAYYAYSTGLFIKAAKVIGVDVSEYEELLKNIIETFRKTYPEYHTQTEYTLAIWFGLTKEPEKSAEELNNMIKKDGYRLKTGFVGTPYILHVLGKYGYSDTAYRLLMRKEYPSWLYAVEKGATTIWEHWDGITENGDFWSSEMNSFNHYAYGAVIDWVYEQAAGIKPSEEEPGFKKVIFEPEPTELLKWLEASVETRHGTVYAKWSWAENRVKYEIMTPVKAEIRLKERTLSLSEGSYVFWI